MRGVYGTVKSLKRGRKAVLLRALDRDGEAHHIFKTPSKDICDDEEIVCDLFPPDMKGFIVISEPFFGSRPPAYHESVL